MSQPVKIITVYKDESGEYRWRAKASNGLILADSAESYVSKAYTRGMAESLFPEAKLEDETGD